MGILQNPKLLYFIRILQFVLSIIFLILICYSGTHRQWWTNINGALALGGDALPVAPFYIPPMTNLHSYNQHRYSSSLRLQHLLPPPSHGRPVSQVKDS